MPPTMQEREQGFEAKFAHDEEVRFLRRARRDKLFAHWAAAELGLIGEQTEALVQTILRIPDGPGHDEAVMAAVASRLRASRDVLSAALTRCAAEAQSRV